jgi:hypothetical protein
MKTGREKDAIERSWKREILSDSKVERNAFEQ